MKFMVTDITTWPFLFIIYFMCATYLNIDYLTYERLDIQIHDLWSVKLRARRASLSVKHIEKNGKKITQPRDIANTIGEAISFNSASTHYSPKFQRINNRQKTPPYIPI